MSKIFCAILLLLFALSQCYDYKQMVPDPYLDVVFQMDQSDSMRYYYYTELFKSLIDWIKSYLDTRGSSSSQFAAILCCNNVTLCGIRHYFDEKNYSDAITAIFSASKQQGILDNWQGCTNMAVDEVFKERRGHRKNATIIDIFVTDCEFHMGLLAENESYRAAAKHFNAKLNGTLVFMCAKNNLGDLRNQIDYAFNDTVVYDPDTHITRGQIYKQNILMLLGLNNQTQKWIIYQDPRVSIIDQMDSILPQREIEVFNCKWNTTCTDECFPQVNSDKCHQLCNTTIYQWSSPRWYGEQCPPQLPKIGERMPCNCTAAEADIPVKSKSAYEIVLAVIGALLLVAIVLVIVLYFVRKRQQRKQRESRGTQSAEGKEKNKGLGVDIQMVPAGTSQGVQSKQGPEKKKGVGVEIVASKGFKSKSKSTSVENRGKSQMKNPSVSKISENSLMKKGKQ